MLSPIIRVPVGGEKLCQACRPRRLIKVVDRNPQLEIRTDSNDSCETEILTDLNGNAVIDVSTIYPEYPPRSWWPLEEFEAGYLPRNQ